MSLLWSGGDTPARSRETRTILCLVLLAVPVYFLWLGANSIWDANEAFYVDTPRHMVETGNYVTPYFNGAERLNKPVLSYWIVAGLYNLFGVSVAVERVGIAMGAVGIIGATFLVGRALGTSLTGLLAALIVATAPRMVMFSRRIFIDIYITLFMALTLACFVMAERYPARRQAWLIGMYVAIGLGVLTKGPVALFFPVLSAAVWMTMTGRWRDVSRMWIMPGGLIILAIVAPWYVALYVEHGWGPILQFFVGENFGRYAGEMSSEGRGVLFYLPVLFGDLFPWAPLLLVPIVSAWRPAVAGESATDASIRRLLWIWIVTIAGVFSLSQSKQDLYIFPVIPAVAALVAQTLADHVVRPRRMLAILLGCVSVLTAVLGAAASWLFTDGYYALDGIIWITAVCVVGGVGTLVLVVAQRRFEAICALASLFVVFNYLFVARVLPSAERLKPAVPLAAAIRSQAGDSGAVGAYHLLFPSLVHYLGRPVVELASVEQAQSFFSTHGSAWIIMSADSYRDLSGAISGLCVADRRPLFEAKLSDLISRQPPNEVLLVTNHCGDRAATTN
jgi:4-amino-4-deoxy-L-arabinose transferase-like glycosyltransferase